MNNQTATVLAALRADAPEAYRHAFVVGCWVWLEFARPPAPEVRAKLKDMGFRWNQKRKVWQHPCGVDRPGAPYDPRERYATLSPAEFISEEEGVPA